MRSPSSLPLAIALVSACASPADVATTATDGPIFIAATGDTVRMHEALRIGRLHGTDEYTFSAIVWAIPTPDEGVLVYDLESSSGTGENGRIRKFDAQGRFVRYVGRPGEGPGEYSSFPDGVLLPDGDLLIADQGLARITRYDTAGKLVASWAGPPAIVELVAATDSGWYVASVTDHPNDKPRHIDFIHYDALGRETARFAAPDAYHNGPSGGVGAVDNSTSAVAILPDGRMISSTNDSLSFLVTSPTGEVRVTAPWQPVAYLAEEREARRAMLAGLVKRSGGNPSSIAIPEFKKAWSAMTTDARGHILFRVRTRGFKIEPETPLKPNQTPWHESFEVEVFDSTLTHRGRLATPPQSIRGNGTLGGNALWLVQEGDAGELYLVKWKPDAVLW